MAIDLPPSSVRATTIKHGAALVEAGLVTQAQLDAVLKNPTLSPAERKEAASIVYAARRHEFSDPSRYKPGALRALAKFHAAVETEEERAGVVTAARGLLSRGEITESQFKGITSSPRTLRSILALGIARQSTDAEVKELRSLHASASPESKVELGQRLEAAEAKLEALATVLPVLSPNHAAAAAVTFASAVTALVMFESLPGYRELVLQTNLPTAISSMEAFFISSVFVVGGPLGPVLLGAMALELAGRLYGNRSGARNP